MEVIGYVINGEGLEQAEELIQKIESLADKVNEFNSKVNFLLERRNFTDLKNADQLKNLEMGALKAQEYLDYHNRNCSPMYPKVVFRENKTNFYCEETAKPYLDELIREHFAALKELTDRIYFCNEIICSVKNKDHDSARFNLTYKKAEVYGMPKIKSDSIEERIINLYCFVKNTWSSINEFNKSIKYSMFPDLIVSYNQRRERFVIHGN